MNYDSMVLYDTYWNFYEKLICRRKKWQEFTGVQRDPSNHIRICIDYFELKCFRKKYPRPLLVHGAISIIKLHYKSPSSPVMKYYNDKVEICRPALESNLSRNYLFPKSNTILEFS